MIKKYSSYLECKGLYGFLKLVSICFLAVPIAVGIAAISPWIKCRLVRLFSYRIGHYALNTELLLCALDLDLFKAKDRVNRFFYCVPETPLCNKQLHLMWKRTIKILPFSYLWYRVDRLLMLFLGNTYQNDPFKIAFESSYGDKDIWGLFNKIKKCHISFRENEKSKAQIILNKMGIPSGAKFICILVRDSGYLSSHLPNSDWSYHDYRDADTDNYQKAAKYLAKQGYYVLRMGKYVKKEFHIDHDRVIDYANSPFQSDFMDIYLSANCFFMMTTSCGLDSVARIFRRPILVTDFPLPDFISSYRCHIFIPKKVYDTKNGKFLTFNQIYQDKNLFTNKQLMMEVWQNKGWKFIDNSAEEILEAAKEMLQQMTLQTNTIEQVNLQEEFWKSFPVELVSYMSSYRDIPSRLGTSFLESNNHLLN